MNPDSIIEYPKNQYKKFIKDVVKGTLERSELIEKTINQHLSNDINLAKTDKLLKIIFLVTGKTNRIPIISVANPGSIKSKAANAIAAPDTISYKGNSFLTN